MAERILRKGENVVIASESVEASGRLQLVLGWLDPDGSLELDISALLLGPDGRVRTDADLIFFNQPTSTDGAVRLLGRRSAEEGCEESVAVDLEVLSPEIGQVVVAASLDSDSGIGFGTLTNLDLALLDTSGQAILRYPVEGASTESALMLGRGSAKSGFSM